MARTGEPLAELMAEDIARQLAGPEERAGRKRLSASRVRKVAVEAALRAMRQGAVEAGNSRALARSPARAVRRLPG